MKQINVDFNSLQIVYGKGGSYGAIAWISLS